MAALLPACDYPGLLIGPYKREGDSLSRGLCWYFSSKPLNESIKRGLIRGLLSLCEREYQPFICKKGRVARAPLIETYLPVDLPLFSIK